MKQKDIDKVKVNKTENGYWLVPSITNIFTRKSSNYAIKFSPTLEELITKNNFQYKNIRFSFNGDKNFYIFNKLMKIKGLSINIQESQVKKMSKKDFIDFEVVNNLIIRLNYKSIKNIYFGNIFFVDKEFFRNFYINNKKEENQKIIIEWTNFGFNLL
ncbi:MPN499 family protein [Mesomycoplasma molare]|uniref:Uncharacterized protein n=1 Tax=Mesomycoplasma molare TaxID=171288 RepID=A0ABY5TUL1_9BACT|nr:hypothetical protein [Mesomycoplasma molare]UWD34338.1 hypothetical protein NX772_00715 [Mesomycoplasma molare]